MTSTGYYAVIAEPIGSDRAGSYARMTPLTRHDTRDEALAEARRVAATRPGASATVLAAHHVEP